MQQGDQEFLQQHRRPVLVHQRRAAEQARQGRPRPRARDHQHRIRLARADRHRVGGRHSEAATRISGRRSAYWGIPQGPYLFIPLFGPTTVRDGTGWIIRGYATPDRLHARRADAQHPVGHRPGRSPRVRRWRPSRWSSQAALDPYTFIRRAYLQRREYLVHDGKPPPARKMTNDEHHSPHRGHPSLPRCARCSLHSRLPASRCLRIAQEAPDALVKRVSQEALQIIKTDPKVQAGDQARIREVIETKLAAAFRLRPDDGARRWAATGSAGDARAAEAARRRVPDAAGPHVFGRAQPVSRPDDRLQAAARRCERDATSPCAPKSYGRARRRCRSTTAWARRRRAGRRTTSSSAACRW